jgi:allophanate hydrolase subunit 2
VAFIEMTNFGAVDFESGPHPVTDFNKASASKSQDVGLSRHTGMLPPHENLRRNSDTSLSGMKSDEESAKKRIKKKRKRLSFDEKVEVLPIPMRHEYSQTERARLWSSAIEIHENATRNTIEFASEG